MCAHKITPMHSCTYEMQPLYYIAPYTEFLIAKKLNQCYGGNAKPIALCCHRPPEMVERDLLYAYQGLKDTTKGEESVEDHLPASIAQGASNLHSDKDMEDKIKLLDPRVQKLIRTYLEVFEEPPPPASCDKLVEMEHKLKPVFVGYKIRSRPYPAPK